MKKDTALRRRIAPSVPLAIQFEDENGKFSEIYRIAFDLNVLAEISEKTGRTALGLDVWANIDARTLRVMLWAALLPCQKLKFDTKDARGQRSDEGLETVGSWLMGENQDAATIALWEAYLLYLPKEQAAIFREEREKAEKQGAKKESAGGEPPLAGSSSGPSADTTSESPKAKSAS